MNNKRKVKIYPLYPVNLSPNSLQTRGLDIQHQQCQYICHLQTQLSTNAKWQNKKEIRYIELYSNSCHGESYGIRNNKVYKLNLKTPKPIQTVSNFQIRHNYYESEPVYSQLPVNHRKQNMVRYEYTYTDTGVGVGVVVVIEGMEINSAIVFSESPLPLCHFVPTAFYFSVKCEDFEQIANNNKNKNIIPTITTLWNDIIARDC
jgi:hypothetical protein